MKKVISDSNGLRIFVAVLGTVISLAAFSPLRANNILLNPGFETGSLGPWFNARNNCTQGTCNPWSVDNADAHSGHFSAVDVGDIELRQNFAPVNATDVSLWVKQPGLSFTAFGFDFFYTNGTHTANAISTGNTRDWEFFNLSIYLTPGLQLDGFSVFGVSSHPPPNPTTRFDDFTVSGRRVTPEPGTLLMLGTGLAALAGTLRRKLF